MLLNRRACVIVAHCILLLLLLIHTIGKNIMCTRVTRDKNIIKNNKRFYNNIHI